MEDLVDVEIDLSQPNTQEIKVSIVWIPKSNSQELSLPIWTPGSYTVRDHSQFLYDIKLFQNGRPLNLNRSSTNMWDISLQTKNELNLKYIIEARNLTVRTCYLEPNFCSLCLSAAIMLVSEHRYSLYRINVKCSKEWKVYMPLEFDGYFNASNYDELVDAPLHAGNFNLSSFKVRDFNHKILTIGIPPTGWPNDFISDISSICNATCKIFGEDPPSQDKYTFVLHMLDKAYGGLEHDNSSVLQYGWDKFLSKNGYRKFLQLIGHEYFHQWNIRRLRPKEFMVYDYNNIVISENLWFAEGITSYFDITIPFIAGLSSYNELLEDLSEEITFLLNTPGRKFQSLTDSSREAWIKLYKSSKASLNSQVSYYRLGTIFSLCLDIKLRTLNSSLSSLLRQSWNQFGTSNLGYSRSDIMSLIKKIDLKLYKEVNKWLDIPDSIDLDKILAMIGFTLEQSKVEYVHSGLCLDDNSGSVIVNRAIKNSPAMDAGIIVSDEIIAINCFRINNSKEVDQFLIPNKLNKILVSRNGKIIEVLIKPISQQEAKWNLHPVELVSEQCIKVRNSWKSII